ncbi:MAG: Mov34/MPN/PAD-1 family protein [Candidatus Micrarchaeota archaeon]|nr:Mov34/MPN/PAD-1 family protein [Candidatus Micrarchaeota archaeon]
MFVHADAMAACRAHFERAAASGLEAMGLLVGKAFTHDGTPYVVITGYVTADNDATAVSVRFSREAFASLSEKIDGGRVVGWAHSHPGYGCFLSATDVTTQQNFFCEDYHVALVVDPLSRESRFFKVKNGRAFKVPFAVVRRKS